MTKKTAQRASVIMMEMLILEELRKSLLELLENPTADTQKPFLESKLRISYEEPKLKYSQFVNLDFSFEKDVIEFFIKRVNLQIDVLDNELKKL